MFLKRASFLILFGTNVTLSPFAVIIQSSSNPKTWECKRVTRWNLFNAEVNLSLSDLLPGHGQCYCGNCYCAAGWHGDRCEFLCDISPWESKRRCTSPDGKICSNRGLFTRFNASIQHTTRVVWDPILYGYFMIVDSIIISILNVILSLMEIKIKKIDAKY